MTNKEVVKRFITDVLEPLNYEYFSDFVADDAIWHGTTGEIQGAAAFQRLTSRNASKPFSEATMTIHDMVAEDDKVTVRFTHTALHTGNFLGKAPTHQRFSWDGIVIYRLENGKIIEAWTYEDLFSLALQLDVVAVQ